MRLQVKMSAFVLLVCSHNSRLAPPVSLCPSHPDCPLAADINSLALSPVLPRQKPHGSLVEI
jgi:hypothetical protein